MVCDNNTKREFDEAMKSFPYRKLNVYSESFRREGYYTQ